MNTTWWGKTFDLDEDQQRVLKLPLDGRHLVTGPPGSGKSNVLVLRAKYLLGVKRENFRILAVNQTLVRFLRASNKVPNEKIMTAQSWLEKQLWDLEGRKIDEPDIDKKRSALCDALLRHLRENEKQGLIHTLLIDEIQDYSTNEIKLFSTIAENVFFVGDIRQQVYASNTTHQTLEQMKEQFNVVELKTHYRIGQNICALADRIAKPSKGHKRIGEGCNYKEEINESRVIRIERPLNEQIKLIAESIENQLEVFPDEFIGVLCPTNMVLGIVAEKLTSLLGSKVCVQQSDDYQNFDLSRPVIISTIHSGKGLEFRCAHIVSAETLKSLPRSRELIYTAVTRAKTTVTIYHDQAVNDFLEDALCEDAPPVTPPTLDSLFD